MDKKRRERARDARESELRQTNIQTYIECERKRDARETELRQTIIQTYIECERKRDAFSSPLCYETSIQRLQIVVSSIFPPSLHRHKKVNTCILTIPHFKPSKTKKKKLCHFVISSTLSPRPTPTRLSEGVFNRYIHYKI